METFWDLAEEVILIIIGAVVLIGWVIHYFRPVTWQDGEGPIVSEEGGGGGFSFPLWWTNFWSDLIYTLLPWRR